MVIMVMMMMMQTLEMKMRETIVMRGMIIM